jgi:AcrR family transcriptional regulator
MPETSIDRRVERTRKVVLEAFFGLLQEARYDDITVADIVARAGVSRSAFYARFAGKDALLATSIAGPFAVLANTLRVDDLTRLADLLDHFAANRALARTVFQEPIRRRIAAVLSSEVERLLDEGGAWKHGPLIMPCRLAAIQLAEMLLAPVAAWLAGEARCSSETLAFALRRVGTAALEAMTLPAAAGRLR